MEVLSARRSLASHFCCLVGKLCPALETLVAAACQAPLSSTLSQSLLKFLSSESVMLSNPLILYCPLLLLPSIFPSIKVFSNELTVLETPYFPWVSPATQGAFVPLRSNASTYCSSLGTDTPVATSWVWCDGSGEGRDQAIWTLLLGHCRSHFDCWELLRALSCSGIQSSAFRQSIWNHSLMGTSSPGWG